MQISDNGLFCDGECDEEIEQNELSTDPNVQRPANVLNAEPTFRHTVNLNENTSCIASNGISSGVSLSVFPPMRKRKSETQFISLPCKKLNPEENSNEIL